MAVSQPHKVQKLLIQPVNLIFRYLQNKDRVSIWLHENCSERIEARIIGFDEYMNLVLDDAEEVHKKGHKTTIGRMLLRGDNIALVQCVDKT